MIIDYIFVAEELVMAYREERNVPRDFFTEQGLNGLEAHFTRAHLGKPDLVAGEEMVSTPHITIGQCAGVSNVPVRFATHLAEIAKLMVGHNVPVHLNLWMVQ